jgi:hypothetical protein
MRAIAKPASEQPTRATVTFPAEIYASLELIAKRKKVSIAWVVREATEIYVANEWPLFAHQKEV